MKRLLLSAASIWILMGTLSAALALTPFHFWSQRFGGTSPDIGQSVAVDGSGNVLVTGYFQGTANFGGGNLTSAGSDDIFVAKYNSAGVHQWSQRFGGTSTDIGYAVAVDGSGNVLVTGYFAGTVNFGGGNLTSAGNFDIFVAKYNSAGVHQWSQRFGGTANDVGYAVAVDGLGNVLVTGYFFGTVNFGGGNLASAGNTFDIFVAKYNSAGVHQWSQRFGSTTGDDYGYAVAVDGSGNVLVTGNFWGTANFGGIDLTNAGNNDIFVAKYNSAGVHQWSRGFGGTSYDYGYSVAVDGSGNVLVTGVFQDTVNFGGSDLTSLGSYDIFVAAYSSAGVHQWSHRFGGASNDNGYSVAVDGSGSALVTGQFAGTVNFGGDNLTSAGNADIFVAKYSPAGAHQWSRGFGGTSYDYGYSVAVDGSGSALVTGNFGGTANFGGSDLTSAGSADVFVAKYASEPAEPVISAITDIGNDQGREVKIVFARTGADQPAASLPVVRYEAYRRIDAPPAATGLEMAGPLWSDRAHSDRTLLAAGWTYVGFAPAHGEPSYSIDVPTIGDSTVALGQYHSVFFIRGATDDSFTYFDSPPDSGYSLDNLAPGVPSGFAYGAGQLTWDESSAEDFDYFSVYGSNTNSFAAATLVDYCVAPTLDVGASPYVFYFVTATDFSGNEGNPAVVNTLTGTSDTPKSYVLSISAYPNPFNPATTIRYTVPSKGHVTVDVFDTRGARVTTLVDEVKEAGAYTREWDGRDRGGRAVTSGVYFARVIHASGTRSYKILLLK